MLALRGFTAIVVLALLWGPAFLFVKVAVQDIPPLTIVATRVGIGALLLLSVLRYQGSRLPRVGPVWRHLAIVALAFNALPFTLLTWGQQYIDSALAAILVGTTPLFTMIMAHLWIADERLTQAKVAGVLLGFGGLVLLVAPSLFNGGSVTSWGLLAAAAASASYGFGIVHARRHLRGLPPLVAPAAQLAVATLYLVPLALVVERPFAIAAPSWTAVGSLLMLSVFSTALAFVVYYRAQESTSATALSMVTFINPVVATLLGVALLGERPSALAYLSGALILAGIIMVNGVLQNNDWHTWARGVARTLALQRQSTEGDC